MNKEELFKNNLNKWAFLNPDVVQILATMECKEIAICQNEDGQLNLRKLNDSATPYFHSLNSPFREAQHWFLSLELKDTVILYVYGIGLGYYYDVIHDWLKEDPQRFVIFLEDQLEVIKFFLETDRAADFLNNKQVRLVYFTWEMSYFSLGFISSLFSLLPFKVTGLKSYQERFPSRINELHARISFFHDMRRGTSAEFIAFSQGGFISNYYKNLFELPKAKLALQMAGQFKNIPAIICGAGPSLARNINFLKTLQDKALIMAGGTAMNVLNGAGIKPHFGLGIDPNPAHYNRLISNIAFEEPFFYRQRMYHPALKLIQGEHLFVTGAGGYRLPSWFEDKLGIPKTEPLEEGHNVVNFNLSIAKDLGCNPILIVGVDLAYSDNLSYAPGLVRHAIHDPKDAFLTKYSHEELLLKNDINGIPVHTLWKWVNESLWFSHFVDKNPDLTLVNCTEGGIGFPRIPNIGLAEAAEKYLTKSFAFSSYIHGEIQNGLVPQSVSQKNIEINFEIINRSLLNCESYCASLMFEFGKVFQKLEKEDLPEEVLQSPLIKEYQEKLEKEEGYQFHLQDYKERFVEIFFPRLKFLESDPSFFSTKDIMIKRTFFNVTLYTFLAKVARLNVDLMNQVLKERHESQKIHAKATEETLELKNQLDTERTKAQTKENYHYQNGCLRIIDPELNLNEQQECDCQIERSYYPSGKLKSEVSRCEQQLYGPARYYTESGQLLAENWYVNNLLEGKGWFYYPSGEIYAIRRYKKGEFHDLQEYYYLSGLPKSIFYYKEGLLEGKTTLFYESGALKREITFSQGKKEGSERMWNEAGLLILEASYHQNSPQGFAREWHANGNLAKEIYYETETDQFEIKQWHANGTLLPSEETRGKSYFDLVAGHSKTLNDSLQNVFHTLAGIAPSLPVKEKENLSTTIEQDLLSLKQEMERLNKYNQEMLFLGGYVGQNPQETLWKTPQLEKMMKAHLSEISQEMKKISQESQINLNNLLKKINELKFQEDDL